MIIIPKYAVLKSFYASENWQNFRAVIIAERGPVCETCSKVIIDPKECEIDHYPIELTPENVTDASISLNPDNVKIRCHKCHDKRHNRFGNQAKKAAFIVYGPPLAGKKTFVRQQMSRGDLVVDMDLLYAAVSMLQSYDKPDNLLINVLGVHNQLVDNVKTRLGRWGNAWVIGGYADRYKREKLADDLGAELVFCNASKEMCLARLAMDAERRCRQDEWTGYINKWFDEYQV